MPNTLISRFFALAVVYPFIVVTASAVEYPQPALEAYGALPQIEHAELSPDGSKIAAIAHTSRGNRLLVFDLTGEVSNRIEIENINVRELKFFENSHLVIVASETKASRSQVSNEYSGAFIVNLNNNEVKTLLAGTHSLYPNQENLSRVIGQDSRTGELLMPSWVGRRNVGASYDLLKVDVSHPAGQKHTKGTRHTRDWFVDHEGNVLARLDYQNGRNTYRISRFIDGKWLTVRKAKSQPMQISGVAPDESGLAFVQMRNDESDLNDLVVMNFDGQISDPVLPSRDKAIESVYTDKNRKILGVRYAGMTPSYAFFETRLEDSINKISQLLPNATILLDSWSNDFGQLLYRIFHPSLGDLWMVHRREENTLVRAAEPRPDIPREALGHMTNFEYTNRDGSTASAVLTLPPDYQSGVTNPLPTIVMPQAGLEAHDRFDFNWMAQFFANRGYAVIQPNLQHSIGFDQRSTKSTAEDASGRNMLNSISDGIKALADSRIIHPERVCVVGSSYRGYAALAGAVFTPELYRCVVAIASVSNVNAISQTQHCNWEHNQWLYAGHKPKLRELASISPINFVSNVTAPVLLIHGDHDTVVPFDQSRRMQKALKRANKSVKLIKLRGADHWLSKATTRTQTLREVAQFVSQHMPSAPTNLVNK